MLTPAGTSKSLAVLSSPRNDESFDLKRAPSRAAETRFLKATVKSFDILLLRQNQNGQSEWGWQLMFAVLCTCDLCVNEMMRTNQIDKIDWNNIPMKQTKRTNTMYDSTADKWNWIFVLDKLNRSNYQLSLESIIFCFFFFVFVERRPWWKYWISCRWHSNI